jgi:endonuclease/exonuclease/phosphatase family metal-dependent hydrolase
LATTLVTRTTPRLAGPSADWREAALVAPGDAHGRLFDACEALLAVESAGETAGEAPSGKLLALSWNAERLKSLDASAERLRPLAADVILLTELDRGMARSGNRDTVGELAAALGMAYCFAVEFIELELGDSRERAWHAGIANREGLHGNAILSRWPIEAAGMVRLERDGFWFDGSRNGERRIGGRNAALARVAGITFCSVHLESHSDPEHRALQTTRLLDAVLDFAGADPIVIGGDFNTATVGHGQKGGLDAERLCNPVPFEPLFEIMAERGFAWEAANEMGVATQRTRPDGTPAPPFGRIDWLFVRGLDARDAATLAAVDAAGAAISDHEILSVTVERRR